MKIEKLDRKTGKRLKKRLIDTKEYSSNTLIKAIEPPISTTQTRRSSE